MPKYSEFKIAGCYLYFTSKCIVEAMHAHASDRKLTEAGSAKFWVMENGDTVVADRGKLTNEQIKKIQKYIKLNIDSMCKVWSDFCGFDSKDAIDFKRK